MLFEIGTLLWQSGRKGKKIYVTFLCPKFSPVPTRSITHQLLVEMDATTSSGQCSYVPSKNKVMDTSKRAAADLLLVVPKEAHGKRVDRGVVGPENRREGGHEEGRLCDVWSQNTIPCAFDTQTPRRGESITLQMVKPNGNTT